MNALLPVAQNTLRADVLLVTATEVETSAVLEVVEERLARSGERRFINDKAYYDLGLVGDARTFLVRSEMGSGGRGGSLLTVVKSIAALAPTTIVMVGIAFGVDQKHQRIGDILVAKHLVLYDMQRVGTGLDGGMLVRVRGERPPVSSRLFARFSDSARDWQRATKPGRGRRPPGVHVGALLSGDKLIDHRGFRDELLRIAPEAIGGEMEGAGLSAAAQDSKVDWLLVKAICDWADGNKGRNKRARQLLAARNAASYVLHVLEEGGFAAQQPTITVEAQLLPARQLPPEWIARPPENAGFIGREAELAAFAEKLERERILIITGMPGVGKTALAASLARHVAPAEQIFWHSCHEGEGADSIVRALAAFLAAHRRYELWAQLEQLGGGAGMPPDELVFAVLRHSLEGGGFLICLDDHHRLEARSVAPLLDRLHPRHGGDTRVLLVSREKLADAGPGEDEPLMGLSRDDARQLVAQHGLELNEQQFTLLYQQTLGNAQLLLLALEVLKRERLPDQLLRNLLRSPEIEGFLLRAVDRGLKPAEQLAMQALAALLEYGGTPGALEALLDDSGDPPTLAGEPASLGERFLLSRRALSEAIIALHDRRLLQITYGSRDAEYRQHDLIRGYYYKSLRRRELQLLHRRAGAYYANEERDLLRAALHYECGADLERAADVATRDLWAAVNAGQARALGHLLARLSEHELGPERSIAVNIMLGEIGTLLREPELARRSFETAYGLVDARPDLMETRDRAAQICRGMGELLEAEDPQAALAWLRRGLEQLGGANPLEEALLYYRISAVYIITSQHDQVRAVLDRCLELLPPNAEELRADVRLNLGISDCYTDNLDAGRDHFVQALAVYKRRGNLWRESQARQNLGQVSDVTGDWGRADEEYRGALALAEQLGRAVSLADLSLNLGLLTMKRGNYREASVLFDRCQALSERHSLRENFVYVWTNRSTLAIFEGRWERVEEALRLAEPMASRLDIRGELPEIYRNWAQLHLVRGAFDEARAAVDSALTVARQLGNPLAEGPSLRVEAQLLLATGEVTAALAAFARSAELLVKEPYEYGRTLAAWGTALLPQEAAQAHLLLGEARAIFERLGARGELAALDRLNLEASA